MTKSQVENQANGRWGELLAALLFPSHWVVRPLPHDFGLDLSVEVFHEDKPGHYVTRGEHLYVQVKTTTHHDGLARFTAGTSDLLLAEAMGASVPVLLLHLNRSDKLLHYVCLTDYIDKILRSDKPNWKNDATTVVYFPSDNVIDLALDVFPEKDLWYFAGLARRGKLYSTFILLQLLVANLEQKLELARLSQDLPTLLVREKAFRDLFQSSLERIRQLDNWINEYPVFGLIENAKESLSRAEHDYFKTDLAEGLERASIDGHFEEARFEYVQKTGFVIAVVATLGDLGRVFEEVIREQRLGVPIP